MEACSVYRIHHLGKCLDCPEWRAQRGNSRTPSKLVLCLLRWKAIPEQCRSTDGNWQACTEYSAVTPLRETISLSQLSSRAPTGTGGNRNLQLESNSLLNNHSPLSKLLNPSIPRVPTARLSSGTFSHSVSFLFFDFLREPHFNSLRHGWPTVCAAARPPNHLPMLILPTSCSASILFELFFPRRTQFHDARHVPNHDRRQHLELEGQGGRLVFRR